MARRDAWEDNVHQKTILIVDDDVNICDLLRLYLQHENYELTFAHDGSTALTIFREKKPSLVILDLMLPVINGWEVCRLIRQESDVPIIMLTARDDTSDKVAGLDSGADDYIVKPFDPREVAARVRAHIRRRDAAPQSIPRRITIDGLTVDLDAYEVRYRDAVIDFKPREIQLLYFLLSHKNMAFSREQLLDQVWGYDYAGETRTVDVHVQRLREKLRGKTRSWRIATVWGVGYKAEDC
ncbi:MAG: DNA-binding response regulator [Ammonifex sp.]|jgi:DNA-binding response OmpR family regulator|nr:MAG: DNA-binding response regulator [Ammonifex sp.]